jgi:hypothetical protein
MSSDIAEGSSEPKRVLDVYGKLEKRVKLVRDEWVSHFHIDGE